MNTPRLIIANWKMYLAADGLRALLSKMSPYFDQMSQVVLCPSSIHIDYVSKALLQHPDILLGAQNLSHYPLGPHTGGVNAEVLKELGCQYVIIGHSECRKDYTESDEIIAQKIARAIDVGMKPIICIGDYDQSGARSPEDILKYLSRQLSTLIAPQFHAAKLIIAYEPLWAIGSGVTPNNDDIHVILSHIKLIIPNAMTLYGGSVNAKTSKILATIPSLDGVLVGGASIQADEFIQVIRHIQGKN